MKVKRLKPEEQATALRNVWSNATKDSSSGMLDHLNQMNELLDSGLLFSPPKNKNDTQNRLQKS